MEHVRKYVSHEDYKSVLLVNKEWNSIFSDNGAAMLVHCLKRGAWLDIGTVVYLEYINAIDSLRILIESLEDRSYRRQRIVNKKPMTAITMCRIRRNPRLNYIDLMGV
jgi:hypothetical protein